MDLIDNKMALRSTIGTLQGQTSEPDRGPRKIVLATALTAVSGYVDAVGYSHLGHLYLSFMSGNSTRLGVSLAGLDWSDALLAASIIAAFVVGAAAGTLLSDRWQNAVLPVVLGVELAVVLGAIGIYLAGHDRIALGLMAATMGMQNTLHQRVAGADVGKSFMTGNLFSLGEALGRLFRDRSQRVLLSQHALSWATFLAGVVIGAHAFAYMGVPASLAVVALVLASLFAATLR
ncbi:YoaK family protein [Chelatococcus asaccharovorans]|uniref:YoaK family protein n=1 Tax=Chelatococcus asaccharovorans TaxID=28210 RepID=UPI00224C79D7|nr:YoaK family protein [Chelatococcus asaccharovorans]CAH1673476.1 putative Oxalate decarboxylase [Chelatococcus asaccharovorans]CAH1675103.1 putative Oxalate decarboxylase [Chelatococcus asaccharovorans]